MPRGWRVAGPRSRLRKNNGVAFAAPGLRARCDQPKAEAATASSNDAIIFFVLRSTIRSPYGVPAGTRADVSVKPAGRKEPETPAVSLSLSLSLSLIGLSAGAAR